MLSIILNWVIPFFCLLPKPAKRSGSVMMKIAVVVLIGRWVDLVIMVFPSTLITNGVVSDPAFGLLEVGSIVCFSALSAWFALRYTAGMQPVPTGDPYIHESLEYHAG